MVESTVPLVMMMPPKADTGSPANASSKAESTVSEDASPQGVPCFMMPTVYAVSISSTKCQPASMSSRLLYDRSLPDSWVKHVDRSPRKLPAWWGFSPYRSGNTLSELNALTNTCLDLFGSSSDCWLWLELLPFSPFRSAVFWMAVE